MSVGDVEELERIFWPDLVWHATAKAFWRGDHEGRAAVLEFLARIGESMEVFDIRLDDTLVSEDRAVLVFHVSAQMGTKRLDVDYFLLARIVGGRVAEVWTAPLDPGALETFFRTGGVPQPG